MTIHKLPARLWAAIQAQHRVGWQHDEGDKCHIPNGGCANVVAEMHRALHQAEARGRRKANAVGGLVCFECRSADAKWDGWGCCATCGCDVAVMRGTKAERESLIEAAHSSIGADK